MWKKTRVATILSGEYFSYLVAATVAPQLCCVKMLQFWRYFIIVSPPPTNKQNKNKPSFENFRGRIVNALNSSPLKIALDERLFVLFIYLLQRHTHEDFLRAICWAKKCNWCALNSPRNPLLESENSLVEIGLSVSAKFCQNCLEEITPKIIQMSLSFWKAKFMGRA